MSAHSGRAHSVYGASGAHRWFACPGSVERCRGLSDDASDAAREGTLAHEVLERVMRNEPIDVIAFPDGMLDHVMLCADYARELVEPGDLLILERPFELPSNAAPGEVFGTCDIIVISPPRRKMWVIDFKYGAGIPVEVRGNKQARFYGLGALVAIPEASGIDEIELVIVQPRYPHNNGPIRTETVSAMDLVLFGGEIEEAIYAAKAPNAPLVPGRTQCQFCSAKTSNCPAYDQMVLDVGYATAADCFKGVQGISVETMPEPETLGTERIAFILRAKPLLEAYMESVVEHARKLLQDDPNSIPGYKVVETLARRHWNAGSEEELAAHLSALCDWTVPAEDFFERRLKALTNAEKVIIDHFKSKVEKGAGRKAEAAKQGKEAMAYLTTKQSSGNLTIAPITDPRPSVDRAQDCFSGITLPKIDMA